MFFVSDAATTQLYTILFVGSVRCVQETGTWEPERYGLIFSVFAFAAFIAAIAIGIIIPVDDFNVVAVNETETIFTKPLTVIVLFLSVDYSCSFHNLMPPLPRLAPGWLILTVYGHSKSYALYEFADLVLWNCVIGQVAFFIVSQDQGFSGKPVIGFLIFGSGWNKEKFRSIEKSFIVNPYIIGNARNSFVHHGNATASDELVHAFQIATFF
eukprot:TRINITY_DN8242_c0_g1_i1.p1 TRINITY_DN8242_c0_g1~~TRINITY_DN8242_c0_g1_i1.p1  ORF type:complete len:212 (+),score=18.13 TRINITY_DN8242_c0_g1_i1:2-637(+)